MKRLLGLFAALVVALSLTACDNQGTATRTVDGPPDAAGTPPATAPATTDGAGATPASSATNAGTGAETKAPTATPEPLDHALRALLDGVAKVRNLPAPAALKTTFIKRAELPALVDSLLTEEDKRWFAETTTLYRLLGHFRADQDYLTVYRSFGSDAILGLYSPVHDQLWVVYEGADVPAIGDLPASARSILVHELVHAIQDFNFALDNVYEQVAGNLDRNQAWTSVVEGDAVTHERLASRRVAAPGSGLAFLLGDLAQARDVPQSIQRELFFPYTTGADWVSDLLAKQGTAAIDAFLKEPPAATSLILHPELLAQGWKPIEVRLADIGGTLGDGWRRESGGTLGEFHLRNYLQLQLRSSEATAAATGWAGDAYDVYVKGDGASRSSVAVFRMRFANASESSAFAQAQRDFYATARAVFGARDGVTTASVPGGPTAALGEAQGDGIVFAIGSTADIAVAALRTVAAAGP